MVTERFYIYSIVYLTSTFYVEVAWTYFKKQFILVKFLTIILLLPFHVSVKMNSQPMSLWLARMTGVWITIRRNVCVEYMKPDPVSALLTLENSKLCLVLSRKTSMWVNEMINLTLSLPTNSYSYSVIVEDEISLSLQKILCLELCIELFLL